MPTYDEKPYAIHDRSRATDEEPCMAHDGDGSRVSCLSSGPNDTKWHDSALTGFRTTWFQ